jgi:hypothetical protein
MKCAPEPFFRFVESRFQRVFFTRSRTWGGAPGWNEGAPLARKTNTALDWVSVKGATFTDSLGQRPRASSTGKSPALKARFIPEMRP